MYPNLFQHLSFHNLFYLNHSEVHNGAKYVLPKVTRSPKLRSTQRFPELAFRRTDFRVPENLISPALGYTEKIMHCLFIDAMFQVLRMTLVIHV